MATCLASPLYVKGLVLNNRLARSATWEALASPEGLATPALVGLLEGVAKGGCALVTTGLAMVSQSGRSGSAELMADRRECLPGLTEVAEAIKKHGGAPSVQLAHCGAQVDPSLARLDSPAGPSALKLACRPPISCRELSVGEIQTIVEDFAAAAEICAEAGFSVIQLHCAHGYLLSQFLSPFYNLRTDRYGGSILNRGRIILEILEAIGSRISEKVVLAAKINNQDYVENGLTIEDARAVAVEMAALGLDLIEISGGLPQAGPLGPIRPQPKIEADEAPFASAAAWFKEKLKIPVYVVGAIRTRQVAEKIINSGQADGISLSRPLIREPNLPRLWLDGVKGDSECIRCNACFKAALRESHGLYCPVSGSQSPQI